MPSVHPWGRRAAATLALGLLPSVLAVPAAHGAVTPAEGVVLGADSPGAVPGRYIVVMRAGAGSLGTSAEGMVAGQVTDRTDTTLTLNLDPAEARRLAADPNVRVVEQDRIVRVAATQRDPVWGLDRIDQRSATPSKTYTPTADGNSVHAYIIDTGIKLAHQQFGGRATYGYDFVSGDPYADDCDGHGTHVAGTVGGSTYGVAKKVRLVAVRVLDCQGAGYLSDVIDGVDWVTENARRPAVANMSLGGTRSTALDAAVQAGIDSGVTFVVAAGNENINSYRVSPAAVAAAITVAATDTRDRRASFSNWGSTVDLFAPGVGIRSAYKSSTTATAVMSGTSMAAPHVAGAAALVLDAAPAYRPVQVRDYLVAKATTGKVTDLRSAPNRLLYVSPPPAAPVITTASLPAGRVGSAYRVQLTLKSGRHGAWSVASGTLPGGLTLSSSGLLSGTPTAASPARAIGVRFTDYVPQTATRTLSLTITP
jgi:subtilisin family serine protease